MHEVSLMDGVLNSIRESAEANSITKVSKLKLVVGKLSMALPDSLRFAFEVLGKDEMFRGAVLEIEETPILIHCGSCGVESAVQEEYRFICADCGSSSVEIIRGRELYIDYYEGD